MQNTFQRRKIHTLVIGSGAAGLTAAVRLHAQGIRDLAIYTEGLALGTSINTGSDKQTYYKLGMYGREADSPFLMAQDFLRGGAMHGDIALVEAALSPMAFAHLAALGVPFPHDPFGQFPGYKTDHDPRRRATSCGPYTSREMCRALIGEVQRRGIEVAEDRIAVKLLKTGGDHICGAIFADHNDNMETVLAENVVFAVGGPGGLFANSVYPAVHTGAIGLAAEIGAKMRNLPEFQFGLASIAFRWNVSGSYMQVLPRFISRAADGIHDEREFLTEYFKTSPEICNRIFLKGYQWPFAAGHVAGSSLIDIFVHIETAVRGRRVYLDYRQDPAGMDLNTLSEEVRTYLERSGCAAYKTPFERLQKLNAPAIELYREHGIDLEREALEIAVCAQHNNGGIAGNLWWESENIKGLFPVGEINGSHGVTRPGGSALNAGQCGAFRAAEYIANRRNTWSIDPEEAERIALRTEQELETQRAAIPVFDWQRERKLFQQRMSRAASFLREPGALKQALQEAEEQQTRLLTDGCQGHTAEVLRNRQLLHAQILYLKAILHQTESGVGSRGSSLVLNGDGVPVHPALDWRIRTEDETFRKYCQVTTETGFAWEPCREVPEEDGWFETLWQEYREGAIYGSGE